jgi:hypothetical protein
VIGWWYVVFGTVVFSLRYMEAAADFVRVQLLDPVQTLQAAPWEAMSRFVIKTYTMVTRKVQ